MGTRDRRFSAYRLRGCTSDEQQRRVERFFSRLKNGKNVDFVKSLKVRGLVKVALLTALAAVATNLRLRYNKAYAAGWRGPDE